jgi:AraC family transcriptional activator of pobA
MIKPTTVDEFYKQAASAANIKVEALLPPGINKEIGHFNVFDMVDIVAKIKANPGHMPYNRREYYKISLVRGHNIAEYAGRVINIEKNALVFATPKIPYHWVPQDMDQRGCFCIFTDEFLVQSKSGVVLDDLPVFKPGAYPVFELSDDDADEIAILFKKMKKEIASSYLYKYDLIRNFVLEIIHYGQKLQPLTTL